MNKKIIRNARIITMNERLDILPNGNILIENGKISAITTQSLEDTDAEITDAEGMFLLPGLINTHTHLPMTMLRGFADDLPLHEWLTGHIFPAEARLVTPENVRIATRLAFIEMIKSGTTCFNDMYFFEDIIAEEAKNAGIRGVMGESMIDFATASFQTVDEGLARCEALIRKWQGDSIIHPSVCVHAPYTCSHPLSNNPNNWQTGTVLFFRFMSQKPGKKSKTSQPEQACHLPSTSIRSGFSTGT